MRRWRRQPQSLSPSASPSAAAADTASLLLRQGSQKKHTHTHTHACRGEVLSQSVNKKRARVAAAAAHLGAAARVGGQQRLPASARYLYLPALPACFLCLLAASAALLACSASACLCVRFSALFCTQICCPPPSTPLRPFPHTPFSN